MALNFFSASLHPLSNPSSSSHRFNQKHLLSPTRVRSDRNEIGVTDNDNNNNNNDPSSSSFSGSSSTSSSSVRTQLDLLEQLTSTSEGYMSDGGGGGSRGLTIRDQLAGLVGDRDDDFSIPLGKKNLKKVSPKFLTTSQKRNIKRQSYLNEVSRRNDSVFFATIGAFVLLPPLVILAIAILTGYVQLFP
ncbi:PREDICTED: myosin-G heavy chain-like [Camelina sativa]|uniref:Myosin-G heavy chain-like n=1 Tax=Camelina sativa TaxID=90675 RepID=A0ABM0YZY7_CAMSA|nr:PREDICTED: myosin-G heavy chain-like [Camelina sativa]